MQNGAERPRRRRVERSLASRLVWQSADWGKYEHKHEYKHRGKQTQKATKRKITKHQESRSLARFDFVYFCAFLVPSVSMATTAPVTGAQWIARWRFLEKTRSTYAESTAMH